MKNIRLLSHKGTLFKNDPTSLNDSFETIKSEAIALYREEKAENEEIRRKLLDLD